MKATDCIAEILVKTGVKVVFGYQGGNIAHMIDSISKRDDMEFVVTYNEQGASFSACGYALMNESLGVAVASSGPGAINLISGIANAYYDSIPCLFITGNVSTPTIKKSDLIRQNAFQENDIVSMVSKVTKYAITIINPQDVRFHLEKAIYLALHGRPGPVLLDIPHNIQKADIDFYSQVGFEEKEKLLFPEQDIVVQLTEVMKNSSRPLIVVGGGARSRKSKKMINRLLELWNIPVVSTLRGLDVISHKSANYIGFGGAYGNRNANYAIKHADTILVLGARLDERFICLSDKSLFDKKNVFHVDIDDVELGRVLVNETKIKSSVEDFLEVLLTQIKDKLSYQRWMDTVHIWRERYPSETEKWTINTAVRILSENARADSIFSLDIGINQMSAAQSISINDLQNCITSAGHAAMGCAIPTAIGAVYADKERISDCFVGDGALHMNIQELLMVWRDKLPIHIILNNNNCLGMIRDYQTKAFASRFYATVDELQEINYEKIANAYGLKYCKAENLKELDSVIALLQSKEACFIELVFPKDVDTCPKIGTDMFEQLPRLSDDEKEQMTQEALQCGNTISW